MSTTGRDRRLTEDLGEHSDKHQRIRFRRDEIVDLSAFPSSVGKEVPPAPRRPWPAPLRWATRLGVLLVCLYALLVGGLFLLSYSGFGAARLQGRAEAALKAAFGSDLDMSIGSARFSIGGLARLNLSLRGVRLSRPDTDRDVLSAEDLSFRLRLLPLLQGRLELMDAELSGAAIATDALGGNPDGLSPILDARGLIDPDLALSALFSGADAVSRAVDSAGAPEVIVRDVTLGFGAGLPVSQLRIVQAEMRKAGTDIELEGQAYLDERPATFTAMVRRGE